MIEQLAFGVISLITLGAAYGVVRARTVFVSAMWLVLSFVGVAGIYALLGAYFLAVTQVLVYVGAISVLMIFAIMLTRDLMAEESALNKQWVWSLIAASSVFGVLGVLGYMTDWPIAWPVAESAVAAEGEAVPAIDMVDALGRSLMSEHLLAFEVISVILLAALVGAIVIARD